MTKFDDHNFISSEVHCIPIVDFHGNTSERLVLRRVFWLNPLGKSSHFAEIISPSLADDCMRFVDRSLVVGWKCAQCNTTLFGTSIVDLLHAPCCTKENL